LVSAPGTIVIFTQMSGFAVLKASTMCVRASVSGGVWLVQNLTTVALALQLAPVTALGSALLLALAAADSDADGDAAALPEASADAEPEAAVDADAAADGAATDAAAEAALDAAGLVVVELHAARMTTIETARTDRWNVLGTELIAPPAPSLDRRDPCPGVKNVRPAKRSGSRGGAWDRLGGAHLSRWGAAI
jgi:hypothetical protein